MISTGGFECVISTASPTKRGTWRTKGTGEREREREREKEQDRARNTAENELIQNTTSAIAIGIAQTVRNKMDELEACVRFSNKYRESAVIGLSKTRLDKKLRAQKSVYLDLHASDETGL